MAQSNEIQRTSTRVSCRRQNGELVPDLQRPQRLATVKRLMEQFQRDRVTLATYAEEVFEEHDHAICLAQVP